MMNYYNDAITPDRPMATVMRIDSLTPMNADTLELATMLGWQAVVAKDSYKVGDLVVYVEIDSVLDPTIAQFAEYGGKPIATRKIRGEISQGVVFPLLLLEHFPVAKDVDAGCAEESSKVCLGDDVTQRLKIKKFLNPYEKEALANPVNGGAFPTHLVPKTSEPRVQMCTKKLTALIGRSIVVTRKEDGTSVTIISTEQGMIVCSRNEQVLAPAEGTTNPYWKIVKQ